jgi:WD40 repeat protein
VKGGWPGTISFPASGQYIAVADAGVGIYLIDVSRKEDALTIVPCPSASVAFWPNDDRTIISGGHDGAVKIWDLPSLQQKCTMLGHRDTILAVLVAPDGNRVVSASQDHTARLWRAATKAAVGAAGEWWKQ